MSKPKFGATLDPLTNPTRDAVHVPIIPVYATELIYGGEPLTIERLADGVFWASRGTDGINGIQYVADPFMTVAVSGDLFYAWVKPETTQKLWHEWTHRDLDKKEPNAITR